MEEFSTTLDHPVLACARAIGAALDEVADVSPVFMPPPVKAAALVELSRVVSRAQGLLGRVLAAADDVARDEGARSAATWLAHHTRASRGRCAAALRLGEALDARWHQVGDALMSGVVNVEQADVIARALDELPKDLDAELVVKAEAHLLAEAAHFDPQQLRVLGRKVLEVIAPDVFEEQERQALEGEERRARATTRLTFRPRGDGSTDIRIRVSDAVAGRLKTYLEAYASPRRGHLDPALDQVDPETGKRIPYSTLLGYAFCALLESIPAERLPKHGGSATSVVVTIDHDQLLDQLGAAGLATGERISAAEAMRLACNAQIIPLVLGGKGQPLHLGRARRLFTDKQRIAMGVRDQQCRATGCDIPAACGARRTTSGSPGPEAGRPTSRTASCWVRGTTTAPTTPTTTPDACPTATSGSPDAHSPTSRGRDEPVAIASPT